MCFHFFKITYLCFASLSLGPGAYHPLCHVDVVVVIAQFQVLTFAVLVLSVETSWAIATAAVLTNDSNAAAVLLQLSLPLRMCRKQLLGSVGWEWDRKTSLVFRSL